MFPRQDKLIEQIHQDARREAYKQLKPNIPFVIWDQSQLRQGREVIEQSQIEYPERLLDMVNEMYKIACFTKHLESLLMWGHYTDSHRGFVVEFDPHHALFSGRDFRDVEYAKERLELTKEPNPRMLLRKSLEWEYEGESRLVKQSIQLTIGTYDKRGKRTKGYYCFLPTDAIKAIYCGCRISEADRFQLLEFAEKFSHVKFFLMRRHRTDFKLVSIPVK